jgi:hypothetical protein
MRQGKRTRPAKLTAVYGIDLDKLVEIAEGLALAFYLLMFTALIMLLAGSAGQGFLLLLAGSCAHIARAGIEEFVTQARSAGARPRARHGKALKELL